MSSQSTPEKEPPMQHQPIDLSQGIKMSNIQYKRVGYQDLVYSSDSDYDEQAESVSDPSFTRASLKMQELALSQITGIPHRSNTPSPTTFSGIHRSAFAVVYRSSSSASPSPPPPQPSSAQSTKSAPPTTSG